MKITLSEELDLEVKEDEVTVGTETKPEELEEKAREVVNPVYANAVKQMSNMDKIRQLYSRIREKAPEHDENPKRPTMHASAKKMRLDENLFEAEYLFNDDEEGYCPSCGSNLNYEGPRFEDTETAYYKCTCPNCGKHFKEVHEVQLVFSHYDEEDLEEDLEETKCVICGGPLGKYGNNAQPVADGRCCDDCNVRKVIPARIKLSANSIKNESLDDEDEFEEKIEKLYDEMLQAAASDPNRAEELAYEYLDLEYSNWGSDFRGDYDELTEALSLGLHGEPIENEYDEQYDHYFEYIEYANEIGLDVYKIAHGKINEDFGKKVKTNPVSWDDFYGVFQKNYKVYPSRERDGWFKLQLKTDDTGKQRGNFDRAKEICDKYNLEYRMTEGPSYKFPFMTVFEPKRG